MGKPKKIKDEGFAEDSLINIFKMGRPKKLSKKERKKINKQLKIEMVELQNSVLAPIDWSSVELPPFQKDFYHKQANASTRSRQEVGQYRIKNNITVQGDLPDPILSFEESGFPEYAMKMIRSQQTFKEPTPLEAQSWPIAFSGLNFIVSRSNDCSGKILSFILPAIVHCQAQPPVKPGEGPIVLVLVKFEIGLKIQSVIEKFGSPLSCVRSVCTQASTNKIQTSGQLKKGSEILITSPQRAVDYLMEELLNLKRCTYVVLYDADDLVQNGLEMVIRNVLGQIRPDCQISVFCNEISLAVRTLAEDFLGKFLEFDVAAPPPTIGRNVNQHVKVCQEVDKGPNLKELILKLYEVEKPGKIIIFAATKRRTEKIARFIGFFLEQRPACLNGDINATDRKRIAADLNKGKMNILVATDIAFRNNAVTGFKHVINFDFPLVPIHYVHRIVRTGDNITPRFSYTFFTRKDALFALGLIDVMLQSNQFVHRSLEHMARLGSVDPIQKILIYHPRVRSGLLKPIATGTGGNTRSLALKKKKLASLGPRGRGAGFTRGGNDDHLSDDDMGDETGSDELSENEDEVVHSTQTAGVGSVIDGGGIKAGGVAGFGNDSGGLRAGEGAGPSTDHGSHSAGGGNDRGGLRAGGGAGFGNNRGGLRAGGGGLGTDRGGRSKGGENARGGLRAGGGAGFGNDRRDLRAGFGNDRGGLRAGGGAGFGNNRGGRPPVGGGTGFGNNRGGRPPVGGGTGFGNNRGGRPPVGGGTGFGNNRGGRPPVGGGTGLFNNRGDRSETFGNNSGGFHAGGGAGFGNGRYGGPAGAGTGFGNDSDCPPIIGNDRGCLRTGIEAGFENDGNGRSADFENDGGGFQAASGIGLGNDRLRGKAGGGAGYGNNFDSLSSAAGVSGCRESPDGSSFDRRRNEDCLLAGSNGSSNTTAAGGSGINDIDIDSFISSILSSADGDGRGFSTGMSAGDGIDIVDRIVRDITGNANRGHGEDFAKRVDNDFGRNDNANARGNDGGRYEIDHHGYAGGDDYSQQNIDNSDNNGKYGFFRGNQNVAMSNLGDNSFNGRGDSGFRNRGDGAFGGRENNTFDNRSNDYSRGVNNALFSRRNDRPSANGGGHRGGYGGNQEFQRGLNVRNNRNQIEPYNANQAKSSGYSR